MLFLDMLRKMAAEQFDFKSLNGPRDFSGDALLAFLDGNPQFLAMVLRCVAEALPEGQATCLLVASDIVQGARKGKPGRKPTTDLERAGRLVSALIPDRAPGSKGVSDTRLAGMTAAYKLEELRREYPRKRKVPGPQDKAVWIRDEAARLAIEQWERKLSRTMKTDIRQVVGFLRRPLTRQSYVLKPPNNR